MSNPRDTRSDLLEVGQRATSSHIHQPEHQQERSRIDLRGWIKKLTGKGDDIVLHSRLSPVALAEKLQSIFGSGGSAMPVDNVIGHGSEQEMTFYAVGETTGSGYFRANLEAEGTGTCITGRFQKNPVLIWVPVIFLVVGVIFLISGIGLLLAGDVPIMLPAIFISLPLFQWAILYFVMKLLRGGSAEEDEEKVIAFLKKHCAVE